MMKFNDNATGPDDMWVPMTAEEEAEVARAIFASTPVPLAP
jgi:hypothetical protein